MSGAALALDPETVREAVRLVAGLSRLPPYPVPEGLGWACWRFGEAEAAKVGPAFATTLGPQPSAISGRAPEPQPPPTERTMTTMPRLRLSEEQYPALWREVQRRVGHDLVGRLARPEVDRLAAEVEAAGQLSSGEPSSWSPVDVAAVLAGGTPEIVPTVLARTDGACLFYPARVHWISGEPDFGKGWLVCHAAAQQIGAGAHVVYVDYEDNAEGVLSRLLALGLEPADVVARFHYLRPTGALRPHEWAELAALVTATGATLAVLDGVTEAMDLHGWDPMDNTDVNRWLSLLPRPLADLGPAVVAVDHVVKDPEHRGNYAIGGQHKQAGITGASFRVERTSPFAKGTTGAARVLVKKDRPGEVRRLATGGNQGLVGTFRMTSDAAGRVTDVGLAAPEPGGGRGDVWRPTHLMEKVSKLLEAAGAPLPKGRIEEGVKGTAANIRDAVDRLVAEGHLRRWKSGAALLHESVRPYREADDPLDEYGRPRIDLRMEEEDDGGGGGRG